MMDIFNANRRRNIALNAALVLVVLLTTCMPVCATSLPHPLLVTTATLGSAGGEVYLPTPYDIRLSLAPHSLPTEAQLTVRVYDANTLPVPNTTVAGNSKVLQVANMGALADMGMLTITAPYFGKVNPLVDFAVVTDHDGHYLPLQPVFDTAKHTFCLTLTHDDFTFFTAGHDGQAPILRQWSVGLKHVTRRPITPYARLKEFCWVEDTPPCPGSWRCWKQPDHSAITSQRMAVVLHGIDDTLIDMNAMAFYLSRLRGHDGTLYYSRVYGVDYRWQAHIAGNGMLVAALWKSAFPIESRNSVDIYAHSMGGLVARWAIEQAGADRCFRRLFTFGTPHNGLPLYHLARCTVLAPPVLNLAFPSISDLLQNKDPQSFMNRLNRQTPPTGVAYYTFAGAHWQGFLGPIGATMHKIYPPGCIFDGIVPATSAQAPELAGKCARWIHPPAWENLNHSAMRGEYHHGRWNFDESTPDTPERRPLRDYILNDASVDGNPAHVQ